VRVRPQKRLRKRLKISCSDVIVPNEGSPEELEQVVAALWRDLRARSESRGTRGQIARE
jgi:hypothetical protein